MPPTSSSTFAAPLPRRRGARVGVAAAGGFVLSVTVHGLAAGALVLVPIVVAHKAPAPPSAAVEVELAPPPVMRAETSSASADATEPRPAPAQRRIARPTRATTGVSVLSATITPTTAPTVPLNTPAAPTAPLRFALSAGTVAGSVPHPLSPSADGSPSAGGVGLEGDDITRALNETQVDVAARLQTTAPIAYPSEARRAEIETDVLLDILVGRDGRVLDARLANHQGYGLDEAALHAIRGYRFSPARRAGQAVPVRMRWTIQFRLG